MGKKLYEYNIKDLKLKEFLELKNKDNLWKVVDDDIFKTIYENSNEDMSKVNDFVLLIEQTGIIETNIQDIFKKESGQYISHKFLLNKLLYNMGRDLFDKIEKDQSNWMYAVLSFESAILIDKYDVGSYNLLLVCNIKAGEKEEIEKNYKIFKKNIEELKEKDYRLYKEYEDLMKGYEETYNDFIKKNHSKTSEDIHNQKSGYVNSSKDVKNNKIKKESKPNFLKEKFLPFLFSLTVFMLMRSCTINGVDGSSTSYEIIGSIVMILFNVIVLYIPYRILKKSVRNKKVLHLKAIIIYLIITTIISSILVVYLLNDFADGILSIFLITLLVIGYKRIPSKILIFPMVLMIIINVFNLFTMGDFSTFINVVFRVVIIIYGIKINHEIRKDSSQKHDTEKNKENIQKWYLKK